MKVICSNKMVVEQYVNGESLSHVINSPSARKVRDIAQALQRIYVSANFFEYPKIEFVEPNPLTIDDFKLAHDSAYVDGVMNLQLENGFGNKSKEMADALPYINGAMFDACKLATPEMPSCALAAGFHHAGYSGWKDFGYFCTFNGLIISAIKMIQEKLATKIAIIDCDMHWGNGTDNILKKMPELFSWITHISFGKYFQQGSNVDEYLQWLEQNGKIHHLINDSDLIIYQAGADVHVDDPYGGLMTTEQMYERDKRMFSIAKNLMIPLTWNLAGGYQVDNNGSINKIIDLHLNTFRACHEVYQ